MVFFRGYSLLSLNLALAYRLRQKHPKACETGEGIRLSIRMRMWFNFRNLGKKHLARSYNVCVTIFYTVKVGHGLNIPMCYV